MTEAKGGVEGKGWSTKIIRIWLCLCIRRWKLESDGGSWLGIVSVCVRVEVVFKPSFVREITKKTRARIFNLFKEPKNRFSGINVASLCSLAGRYVNSIPTRFLAPYIV
jgi:hypothetical protein